MGETPKIMDVEDAIIFEFCQDFGGLEEGMPIIREQFKKANVDFRTPTKEGLVKVVENLVTVTRSMRGDEMAKKQKAKFLSMLKTLD
jgi:hypothetical protein